MSLQETVADGNRRESLVAIRDRVARELEEAEGRDVAVLAKQLAEVIREIDGLPSVAEVSEVADLRKRRESRRKTQSQQRTAS